MKKSTLIGSVTTTSCTSPDSNSFPSLSAEKWEQVFSKLTQKEVAQARIVCPYWKTIIDNNYKFSIKIRETLYEELPVPFKVKSCCIYRLKRDVEQIFKYPFNVEDLKLLGKVNLPTLRNIFTETTYLKDLYFIYTLDLDGEEIYVPDKPIHFKNLLKLSIANKRGYYAPSNALTINTERMFSYEMPLLNKLFVRIYGTGNEIKNIFPSFFRFLAKHGKTVQILAVCFIPDLPSGVTPLIQNIFSEVEAQTIIQKLQDSEFQMIKLILKLPTIYLWLWELIIENQKKLITLYVECTKDEITFTTSRVPFNLIKPTVNRNASTLENLYLVGITLEKNQNRDNVDPRVFFPMDGLVFKNLNKLCRLILKRNRENYLNHIAIETDLATFTNIKSIPLELLEVLEITRFFCETSELETLVKNAPRLKIVIFHHTGISNGKGVSTRIIDNLTKKRDILIIDVCPVKNPQNYEEQKKLEELEQQNPQAFRLQGRHYYFNFDRLKKGLEQEAYRPYMHPFDLQ